MFNSTPSYHINGASVNFRLRGTPEQVALDVNRLFNFGVITNIPDTFKAGTCEAVTVQSDRGRVSKGFLAIAESDMFGTLRQVALRSRGKSFVKLAAEADALAAFMAIPRERARTAETVRAHVPTLSEEDAAEISPEFRKLGKKIIAHYFGAKGRDSVNARNRDAGEE